MGDSGDSEEFDDYIESFGYYNELGQAWNMGFYPIPGYDFTPLKGSYRQRLQDPRWKKKSTLVKKRAEWKCQDCGSTNQIETHHCYYTNIRDGPDPWEYPLSALRCLCRYCHDARTKSENRFRAYIARLTKNQIDSLKEGLDKAFYFFGEDTIIEFLLKLGRRDDDLYAALDGLLKRRNETD